MTPVLARSLVLLLPLVAATAECRAQETLASPVRPVVAALEGAWRGTGVLLGRPATFDMRWEAAGGGFVRLAFTNAFVDGDGRETPVLEAHAVYHVRGDSALGVWLDDRPQRITLLAELTDSSLVAEWTAPTERGRTEYRLRAPDGLVVRDYVRVDGGERLFAEATYRRAPRVPGVTPSEWPAPAGPP